MHLPALNAIGTSFGRDKRETTFNDAGRVPLHSPLRAAYSHVIPTLAGYLAGTVRLARIGQVDLALLRKLTQPLTNHLLGLYAGDLAVIFGDRATAEHVRDTLDRAHRGIVLNVAELPAWYTRLYPAEAFSPNNPLLKRSVVLCLCGAVARAHLTYGLIEPQLEETYLDELSTTVGWASGVHDLPGTFEELARAESNLGIPLLDAQALEESGMADQVAGVLATSLQAEDGITVSIGSLLSYFGGLLHGDDRAAFGLGWTKTDQAVFDHGRSSYYTRVLRDNITDCDLFDVAVARAQ